MKRAYWMGLIVAVFLLPAYGGFTLQRKNGDDEAKAKLFTPNPTKALVYAFRDNSFKGKQAVAKLIVKGKVVAENANNHFSVIAMDAGSYELGCASGHDSNVVVGLIHNKKKEALQLDLEAGQIYYVQQVFKAMNGFSLKVLPAEKAQPIIKKAELAEMVEVR